jgi:hypothetical protein
MSTYKVLQDVEAEDKLVGPLTLRQCIYAAIAGLGIYLSFLAYTKHVGFIIIVFAPIVLFALFLAIPWRGDQPTEVWAVAKLRFRIKPRKRVWDQSGIKNLVTVTAPKHIEERLTNGLSENEVKSRLHALASTIDSRGWATKNMSVNLTTPQNTADMTSDRLVESAMLPQEVSTLDVRASDDMLDAQANPIAQHFDAMISNATTTNKQRLMQQIREPLPQPQATPSQPQPQYSQNPAATAGQQPTNWFMPQPAAQPIAQPAPLTAQPASPAPTTAPAPAITRRPEPALPPEPVSAAATPYPYGPTATPQQFMPMPPAGTLPAQPTQMPQPQPLQPVLLPDEQQAENLKKAQVTSEKQAAILNLARNDDLSVATLARQANEQDHNGTQEVVIPLR